MQYKAKLLLTLLAVKIRVKCLYEYLLPVVALCNPLTQQQQQHQDEQKENAPIVYVRV